jgi:hypothetical protein
VAPSSPIVWHSIHGPLSTAVRGQDDANRRPQGRGRVVLGAPKGDGDCDSAGPALKSRLEFLSSITANADVSERKHSWRGDSFRHWNDIRGSQKDARRFGPLEACEAEIAFAG